MHKAQMPCIPEYLRPKVTDIIRKLTYNENLSDGNFKPPTQKL